MGVSDAAAADGPGGGVAASESEFEEGAGGLSGEFGSSSNSTSREGAKVGMSDVAVDGPGGGVAVSESEFEEGAGSVVGGVGVTGSAFAGVRCWRTSAKDLRQPGLSKP